MYKLNMLSKQKENRAIHIADDDMIHITWKHVTIRLNVTGLIYLVEFLNGDDSKATMGFEAYGTLDDGFQIWVLDVGLRLSPVECAEFKQLLEDGLATLRSLGKNDCTCHLPDSLKLTVAHKPSTIFSGN
ncbi:MAG: hypothetical protein AAFV93_05750 [Chloroflexota bacterium]